MRTVWFLVFLDRLGAYPRERRDLGYANDPRLSHAIEALLSKQDNHGRWRNEPSCSRGVCSCSRSPGTARWGAVTPLGGLALLLVLAEGIVAAWHVSLR
jgi:hypothetical protein